MEKFNQATMNSEPLDDKQELIDSAASRPSSETNYLPESNIRYLLNGETGSYNEKHLREKVNERAEKLSVRIQRLIYDIAALEYGGYLNDVNQNWDYLPDLSKRAQWSIRNLHGRDADTDVSETELQLGFSIGLALSAITGTVFESDRGEDFLAGLVLAYETDEHYKAKNDNLEDQSSRASGNKIDEEIAKVLSEYRIEPSPYLNRLIELDNHARASLEDDRELLAPEEAAKEFVKNSFDNSFERHCKLRSKLDQEWKSIGDASVPGIGAQEALEAFWNLTYHEQTSNKVKSIAIAKQMGKKDTYKKTVSNVFNKLSEDGKTPSSRLETTYRHGEIVQWSSNEWAFTDYGRLLAYHVFEKNLNHEWIQRIAIGAELPLEEHGDPSEVEKEMVRRGIEILFD